MITLFFIRHAESVGNVNHHLIGGQSNHLPLTDRGEEQARSLGERLAREGLTFEALHSSTAVRAQATARIIAPFINVREEQIQTSADLLEVSQGEWEGALREEIYNEKNWAAYLADPLHFKAPQGESVQEVQLRMHRWLQAVIEPYAGQTVTLAAVSHGYALRCLLVYLLDGDAAMARRMVTHNTSLTVLQYREGQWLIERFNDHNHLQGQTVIGHYG